MRMFFMLVLMVMSSAFAMAQEAYGIKIAGVEVTSENCADLSVIEGVSGKVSFDAATNTLTLDNANIVNAKEEAILNDRCEGLVIKVLGKNNITDYCGGLSGHSYSSVYYHLRCRRQQYAQRKV